jgi:hypothetical protein
VAGGCAQVPPLSIIFSGREQSQILSGSDDWFVYVMTNFLCVYCRHDADFAWQLSVPIYHPTTTLVMVVYGEAGRGKITFLGKLHYRISYLMYLNQRSALEEGPPCNIL